MKKFSLIVVGFISLILAIVGIVLPLLPTTPLLLLSAACFFRSSAPLYKWVTNHKIFGTYITSYHRYHAVSAKAKLASILTLWICISISAFFVVSIVWAKILLFVIAAGVTIYILNLRTLTEELKKSIDKQQ